MLFTAPFSAALFRSFIWPVIIVFESPRGADFRSGGGDYIAIPVRYQTVSLSDLCRVAMALLEVMFLELAAAAFPNDFGPPFYEKVGFLLGVMDVHAGTVAGVYMHAFKHVGLVGRQEVEFKAPRFLKPFNVGLIINQPRAEIGTMFPVHTLKCTPIFEKW